MIHRIEVTSETDPAELKKLFRKKLMTGGAVIRLAQDVAAEDLRVIFTRFSPGAAPENLNSLVLAEIARAPQTDADLRRELSALALPNVQRALAGR